MIEIHKKGERESSYLAAKKENRDGRVHHRAIVNVGRFFPSHLGEVDYPLVSQIFMSVHGSGSQKLGNCTIEIVFPRRRM